MFKNFSQVTRMYTLTPQLSGYDYGLLSATVPPTGGIC